MSVAKITRKLLENVTKCSKTRTRIHTIGQERAERSYLLASTIGSESVASADTSAFQSKPVAATAQAPVHSAAHSQRGLRVDADHCKCLFSWM